MVLLEQWLCIFVFRLANAALLQTMGPPDEFWQGPEVAYWLVWGQGELTWEWHVGLRSWLHPSVIAAVYKVLALLGMDSTVVVSYAPAVLFALVSYGSDVLVHNLSLLVLPRRPDVADTALFLSIASWFVFYCSPRPLSNCLEAFLTLASLNLWFAHRASATIPRNHLQSLLPVETVGGATTVSAEGGESMAPPHPHRSCSEREGAGGEGSTTGWRRRCRCWGGFLFFAGLATVVRATAAVSFLPCFLASVSQPFVDGSAAPGRTSGFLVCTALLAAVLWLGMSAGFDFAVLRGLALVPADEVPVGIAQWEFFKFNFLSGRSAVFGTHPWHWYLTQGLPAVLGPTLFWTVRGAVSSRATGARHLTAIVAFTVAVYSLIGHKEFRFLLPAVYPCFILAAIALADPDHAEPTPASEIRATTAPHPGAQKAVQRPLRGEPTPASKIRPEAPGAHDAAVRPVQRQLDRGFACSPGMALLVILNAVAGMYFTVVHQRGPLDAVSYLAMRYPQPPKWGSSGREADEVVVDALLPCYSLPGRSRYHGTRLSIRQFDCSPLSNGETEHTAFRERPLAFVQFLYLGSPVSATSSSQHRRRGFPQHFLVYSHQAELFRDFFDRNGFVIETSFMHSPTPIVDDGAGERLVLYTKASVQRGTGNCAVEDDSDNRASCSV
ncbi:GPI mannosyltransferase 3 [Diplonema papillatum]|nr:GPI mannosyltransferase 3 [Diplonema papillatum]